MRFDIDCIDLMSIFCGWLFVCLFTGILWLVGALFEISLIMDIGYCIFVGAIVFMLLFMILFGIALIYVGVKWYWKLPTFL